VRVCGYEALEGGIGVDADGSITSVAYCPIGIDAERTERDLHSAAVQPKIEALRQLYKGKKIIVGRDKLDWTKGVLPKVSTKSDCRDCAIDPFQLDGSLRSLFKALS
jgi:trehalose 6-phosphate synthase/phosphatase